MRELKAMLVESVLLDWVHHVLLDVQEVTVLFDDFSGGSFWDSSEHFFDVTIWASENREFLGIKDIFEGRHLLEKSLQVKSSFVNELDVFISYCFLWGKHWKWNSWPSLGQFLIKLVEFIVSAIALPHAFGV